MPSVHSKNLNSKAWLSLLLLIPAIGLMAFGCYKEKLSIVVTGVVVLVLGVLMAATAKELTQVLLLKIRQLTKISLEEGLFFVPATEQEASADDRATSIANNAVKELQRRSPNISEQQAKEMFDRFLSAIGKEATLWEESEDK